MARLTIHERMVLRQTLPKRSRFLNQIVVVTGLRPRQRGFEGATIPNAKGAPEFRDQSRVNGDHLVNVRIIGHWARRRRSSGCRSMNSSTASRKGDEDDGPFPFRKSMNCLTDSCCSGVSEPMTSA